MVFSSNAIFRMRQSNQSVYTVQKPIMHRTAVVHTVEELKGKRIHFLKDGKQYEGVILDAVQAPDNYCRLMVQAAGWLNPLLVHGLNMLGFVGMVHVEAER